MDETDGSALIVKGRACGSCTMCCKLPAIPEIPKPRQTWCDKCAIGKGCTIYETRPDSCQRFFCAYLTLAELDERWRPSRCRLVAFREEGTGRVVVHVDGDRKGAWRKDPFYPQIKLWARAFGQVIVFDGADAIFILPDRDKDLGPLRDDQIIIERRGADGRAVDAYLANMNDPSLPKSAPPPPRETQSGPDNTALLMREL